MGLDGHSDVRERHWGREIGMHGGEKRREREIL
jgi:hypothetical protein